MKISKSRRDEIFRFLRDRNQNREKKLEKSRSKSRSFQFYKYSNQIKKVSKIFQKVKNKKEYLFFFRYLQEEIPKLKQFDHGDYMISVLCNACKFSVKFLNFFLIFKHLRSERFSIFDFQFLIFNCVNKEMRTSARKKNNKKFHGGFASCFDSDHEVFARFVLETKSKTVTKSFCLLLIF